MNKEPTYKFNGFTYKVFLDKFVSNDVREFFAIESENHKDIPKSLYKYYGLNSYGIQAFVDNEIFASHPYHLNDPFDCNRDLIDFSKASLKEIQDLNNNVYEPKWIEKLFYSEKPSDKEELYHKLRYIAYNALYMYFGIFSMSANYKRMEMWSYYNLHRGFCLKFNLKLLPDSFIGPFPINYTNEFKPIEYSILKKFSFLYQSNIKAKCWKDESEWRLLFHSDRALKVPCFDMPGSKSRIFKYDSKAIEEIILGFNFFDQCEIDTKDSTRDNYFAKLKINKRQKQKILRYALSKDIPISIINLKKETTSEIDKRPAEITKISCSRYRIKYIG